MTRKTILSWNHSHLAQTHTSPQSTLISSGCSFTDCSHNTEGPINWVGYLNERVKFNQTINLGLVGAGNEYISTSIVNQIESMSLEEINNCIVIIVWSGIARKENLITQNSSGNIDDIVFKRIDFEFQMYGKGEALRSWKNIIMMQHYLKNKNIPFGFSFFVNTFDPPFLPSREIYTSNWIDTITLDKLSRLKQCNWIHNHNNSLFDYCFKNDLLSDDLFHPDHNGYLSWTDNILLPGLTNMGIITPVGQ